MKLLRRKDRGMDVREATELLAAGEYGVLSTVGQDAQPYGVPLSYVYRDGAIYLHCAVEGHKLENIAANPRVSFCVVGKTRVLPEKFATEYESVIAFGSASEVAGEEKKSALLWLVEKYSPDFLPEGRKYIESSHDSTRVVKVAIDHLSGKARRSSGHG